MTPGDDADAGATSSWRLKSLLFGHFLAPLIGLAYFVGFCILWGRHHPGGEVWTWIKGAGISAILAYFLALMGMRVWPLAILGLIALYAKGLGYL